MENSILDRQGQHWLRCAAAAKPLAVLCLSFLYGSKSQAELKRLWGVGLSNDGIWYLLAVPDFQGFQEAPSCVANCLDRFCFCGLVLGTR